MSDMKTVEERFWAKVEKRPDGCWHWIGYVARNGYGRFGLDRRVDRAHRVPYAVIHGLEIPADMDLDHLCRNRSCVNPAHMEPVTRRENILRGEGLAAKNARKTHCYKGHPFTPENTRVHDGKRYCRACSRQRSEGPRP